ncbi:nitroreductase family protein [Variovorax terrae]|uniref:Nitroreductase family protein n=1 Tax=Variovorax terrae TaxID=2923278 RepID=A0A9X2ANE3_9BURK|nr:nitroreductase family protein [Variovorax terrae]MCJ0762352.1 nitroreductase family protein [Variovorax terrae]
MEDYQLQCLEASAAEGDLAGAARRCGLSVPALRAIVAGLEQAYGRPLLTPGLGDARLTPAGRRVTAWGQRFRSPRHAQRDPPVAECLQRLLAPLITRRSISPKRLVPPAPGAQEVASMVQAALSAPDHGGLHPWRIIAFADADRPRLADLFEAEKLRRDPLAGDADVQRAREHATRTPALLAFVVSPHRRSGVPLREQWLAAGAALGNFLNAAHQLGYGAIVLSGERCHDAGLASALGLVDAEWLAGFISLGSVAGLPPARQPTPLEAVYSTWEPGAPGVASSTNSAAPPRRTGV